jgi:transcriptional regulator of acetoin/glycerol metabolism
MMAEGSLIDIDDLPENLRNSSIQELSPDESFLSLEEVQRRHVIRVLDAVGGHKTRAAEILGIGRATIYEMLAKMKGEAKKATV